MNWYKEMLQYLPFLMDGLFWTIIMSLGAMAGGVTVGLACAVGRASQNKIVRIPIGVYVDIFRATPPLIQLLWIYYALPVLTGVTLTGVQAGLVGMSLHAGAYFSEIFRAGLDSIGKGQREAAAALGMAPWRGFFRIILPQALRNMLPTLVSTLIIIVKESSLLSFVSVSDLLRNGQIVATVMQRNIEPLTVVAAMYLLVTAPLAIAAHILEARRRHVRT